MTKKHIQNALKNKVTYKNQTGQCSGINKTLQWTYSIESMGSETDCIGASLNLEEIINYNIWNDLTVGKMISSLTFLKW